MTQEKKLNFKIRCSKENYLKITNDLENYIDMITLEYPGDGEEILEILAKHGIEVEHGTQRDNFILCGKCGGVLYKTLTKNINPARWMLKCLECDNQFYPQKMDCMDKTQCKEVVREEQMLNNFEYELTGMEMLERPQVSFYRCGPETTGSINRDREKMRK